MARGGIRPGAGRPKGASSDGKVKVIKEAKTAVRSNGWESPLEYMLSVMNDVCEEPNRRDKMAMAAAPYVHARAGDQGKKDEKQEAAKKAGAGKFGAASPPRLVSSRG